MLSRSQLRDYEARLEEREAEVLAATLCAKRFCSHHKYPDSELCFFHEYLDRVEHFDWVSGDEFLSKYGAARQAESAKFAIEAMQEMIAEPKLAECLQMPPVSSPLYAKQERVCGHFRQRPLQSARHAFYAGFGIILLALVFAHH
jgi:hypothetical protein